MMSTACQRFVVHQPPKRRHVRREMTSLSSEGDVIEVVLTTTRALIGLVTTEIGDGWWQADAAHKLLSYIYTRANVKRWCNPNP